MKKSLSLVVALVLSSVVGVAQAALAVGAAAPDFSINAALGGREFRFSLAEQLRKGPVVLYFFPAAFTQGCTIEAHEFAEATDQYAALGARVIGVSHDGIDALKKFSVTECRDKFAVGADVDQKVMKSYDAVLEKRPELANRTSYLIAPDGHVVYEFTSLDPSRHVENTLAALKTWLQTAPAAKP